MKNNTFVPIILILGLLVGFTNTADIVTPYGNNDASRPICFGQSSFDLASTPST